MPSCLKRCRSRDRLWPLSPPNKKFCTSSETERFQCEKIHHIDTRDLTQSGGQVTNKCQEKQQNKRRISEENCIYSAPVHCLSNSATDQTHPNLVKLSNLQNINFAADSESNITCEILSEVIDTIHLRKRRKLTPEFLHSCLHVSINFIICKLDF